METVHTSTSTLRCHDLLVVVAHCSSYCVTIESSDVPATGIGLEYSPSIHMTYLFVQVSATIELLSSTHLIPSKVQPGNNQDEYINTRSVGTLRRKDLLSIIALGSG